MPEISGIGVLTAFLAGVVSFLSPCVLPLVPGYVSYVGGQPLDDIVRGQNTRQRFAALFASLFFVLGFSAVFIALGAGASAVGGFMRSYLYEASYVAGGVIILFGFQLMGILKFPWMNREMRFVGPSRKGGPVGAFLLGTAFAFGWTPCIGPILGAILTLSATTLGVTDGVMLLSIYSMGLAIPFLLVAAFTDHFMAKARSLKRFGRPLQIISGGILVLVGVAMATGYLFSFGTWMLKTFPIFQDIQI